MLNVVGHLASAIAVSHTRNAAPSDKNNGSCAEWFLRVGRACDRLPPSIPPGNSAHFPYELILKLYFYRVFFSRTPRVITLFSFPAIEQLSNYPRKSESSPRVGEKNNRRERSTNYKFQQSNKRIRSYGFERLSHRNNKRENCEYTALGATRNLAFTG